MNPAPTAPATADAAAPRRGRAAWLALVAIQLGGAALCAAIALPWLRPPPATTPSRGPHLGAATRLDEDALPERLGVPHAALADALAALASAPVTLAAGDLARQQHTWSELGLAAVAADDAAGAAALARRGYRLRPARLSLTPDDGRADGAEPTPVDVLLGVHPDTVERSLAALAGRIDRDALPARWDFRAGRALGDLEGRRLDRAASLERVLEASALPGGPAPRVELVVESLPARVRRSPDLDGFAPAELLATFSTTFKTRNKDRAVNLTLAARAIDGLVLLPGQTFSYNETVGERSLARGYREAPVIEHGEIVEGIGGGACQVSSTLHAASLFGGLEVLERQSHSLPSSYIDMGLDAVVAWPLLDLKLRNPYPFPVVLRAYIDEDRVRAELRGPQPGRRVVLRKEISDEIAFAEEIEVDPSALPGTVQIVRAGKVGYRVQRGRIVWKDGKEDFERLPTDLYQARSQRVRIGPDTVYPEPVPP